MATRKTSSRASASRPRKTAPPRTPAPPPTPAAPTPPPAALPPPPPPAPRSADPIVFVVRGDTAASDKASREVRIADTSRAASASEHKLEAIPGRDVVELILATRAGERITLTLGPENARDLLLSQEGAATGFGRGAGSRNATREAAGEVRVPAIARWAMPPDTATPDAASRSVVGDLVFDTLRLVGLDPRDALAKASADAIRNWRDQQVDEGVYRLAQGKLDPLKGRPKVKLAQVADPQLVLIHGTFVDTTSTFGKWWSHHPGLVRSLFDAYRNEVYALDHATLGKSPIANALTLARVLPDGARLHLVTHSRGGLVAEALARACAGIGDADLAFFAGNGYAGYRTDLQALGRELQGRNITVERIVRVACPAHGTYLASGRLDAYFSVLGHLLDRVGVPLGSDGTAFIREIARRRSNPNEFPGLESMLPSHPVAQWVGSPGTVKGDLRVVAGDVEPNLLDSWLRALAAYALYPVFMNDNDLVVQTSSMYGGAQRTGGATFLLERGSRTDHVSYFANDSTANAITQALLQPQPQGFLPIGPSSRAGLDSSGARAARRSRAARAADGSRPAVILLPGILGSNLRSADAREWLVWWRLPGMVGRIAWRDDNKIEPDGPIEDYYADLMDYLDGSHDVVPVAFDWRAPLASSADRLARQIARELALREASGQPVRILAHSMGGLVARVMQLEHADLWDKMMKRNGASFVMLGTPNAGSWAPMTIFTGDDRLGRTLASVGGLLREKWARDRFAEFEGLVQMQAGLLDTKLMLSQRSVWEQLAQRDEVLAEAGNSWHNPEGLKDFYQWAIPTQAALTDAATLRRRLDDQAAGIADGSAKIAIVLGQAPNTPCGIDASGSDIAYQFTAEGDGRVTWADACLPGVPVWRADPDHGSLPKAAHLFKAYEELLLTGTTTDQKLSAYIPGAARGTGTGAPAGIPRAPVAWTGRTRGLEGEPLPLEADLLRDAIGGSSAPRARKTVRALRTLALKVQHGDVRFVSEPLLIGHSSSLELTGAERVIDGLMGGALRDSLQAGLYPDGLGERQIFDNNRPDPHNPWAFARPRAVIVVGLGPEGDLKPAKLRETVRRGVLTYLQRVAEQRKQDMAAGEPADTTPVSLAMTSIGSGGSLSVAESIINAVHGVQDANAQIPSNKGQPRWPGVGDVMVIELYQNRAAEAWQSLRLAINSGDLNAQLAPTVMPGRGGLSRPADINYRGANHDLIRVASGRQLGVPSGEGPGAVRTLDFTLFTQRARSEVRAKGTQPSLVNSVVAAAERTTRTDRELGRTLYQLLVPLELRPYLGNGSALVLELDPVTAQYPWEMMDDYDARPGAAGSDKPLGLRMGSLLRRLALRDFRPDPVDSPCEDILVLGMSDVPTFRGSDLPELEGVRTEVNTIAESLQGSSVTLVLDQPFLTVVKSALSRPWKVVHLAGHGIHEEGGSSGMILADDTVFGPTEFESMGQVPELVFVNCCHLGKADEPTMLPRNVFAANVAEQLIRMGVRCVVAAGWAVDDQAASAFAGKFYETLIAGQTFADAVRAARMAAYEASPASNTWGAYQCYGDAAWRLHGMAPQGRQKPSTSTVPAMSTDVELLARLEAIEVEGESATDSERRALVDRLRQLVGLDAARAPWFEEGRVAEAVARSWDSLGDSEQAIAWYGRALGAADGSASLKAREQQLSLLARKDGPANQTEAAKRKIKATRLAVLADLEALVRISPTAERFNLIASTHKRLAMDADAAAKEHLVGMRDGYAKSLALNPPDMFYPSLQKFLAELQLLPSGRRTRAALAADAAQFARLRQVLVDREKIGIDFWSVAGHTELDIYEAMLQEKLSEHVDGILHTLADTHARASRPSEWGSILNTARFALLPYRKTAPPREQQAVDKLIQLLETYGPAD